MSSYIRDYYIFVMVILIGKGSILFGICTSLLVGVKNRRPNCLMPFLIWTWISHSILNTAFFIFTIVVFVSPSSRLDQIELALHYQYVGKGVIFYILEPISFTVVFLFFRSMNNDKTNKIDV